jgi:hypothetical protein
MVSQHWLEGYDGQPLFPKVSNDLYGVEVPCVVLSPNSTTDDSGGTCQPANILVRVPGGGLNDDGLRCTARCPLPIYEDS